jgi:homoserine O-succinyltransferase
LCAVRKVFRRVPLVHAKGVVARSRPLAEQTVPRYASLEMPKRLTVCLIDMNAGVDNEAMRCFRAIVSAFLARVRGVNPELEPVVKHVQPRNLGELPPAQCDLYLSTGGPGSPFDGYDEPWCTGYRRFLDGIVDEATVRGDLSRSALVICHSFEIAIEHFAFAKMARRKTTKFGVMPVYMTREGEVSPLLSSFGDRLFAWEHRDWEAVGLDLAKLQSLQGELWATESRDRRSKGEGLLAFRFGPGIEGTQFHPEADRDGARVWIERPEHKKACIDSYGELTYARMLKSLDDPKRIDHTFKTLIPGWLLRRFNALAPTRSWTPVNSAGPLALTGPPKEDNHPLQ